jgi:hypothetical protein
VQAPTAAGSMHKSKANANGTCQVILVSHWMPRTVRAHDHACIPVRYVRVRLPALLSETLASPLLITSSSKRCCSRSASDIQPRSKYSCDRGSLAIVPLKHVILAERKSIRSYRHYLLVTTVRKILQECSRKKNSSRVETLNAVCRWLETAGTTIQPLHTMYTHT